MPFKILILNENNVFMNVNINMILNFRCDIEGRVEREGERPSWLESSWLMSEIGDGQGESISKFI